MADGLENLNFQVILDHKDFDREVKKVERMAKDLNKEVAEALKLKQSVASANNKLVLDEEKIKQATAKTAQEQEKINTQKAKTRVEEQKIANLTAKTQGAQMGVAGAVSQTNARLFSTASIMRTLSALTGTAFSVVGIRRFLSSLIEVTGQFEVQKMALRSMLQDIDAADKIYEDLYRFSSESTYRFSELAKYAKQLAAFNIPKEDLLETTKMLGDVASGVGVSMDRIILAYGHVKSSGFLRGIQLRSFSQNGVPILEELAKQFSEIEQRTVSLGEIFDKMMKRQIPFEMVEEAFKRMTSEGGKFYQMQEVLAKTLAGQINILKGRWENMLAAIGQANSGVLKNTVATISDLIANVDKLGKEIGALILSFGAYKTILIGLRVASQGLALTWKHIGTILNGIVASVNPWAVLAASVAAAGYAIYKYSTRVSELDKIQQAATKNIEAYNKNLDAEKAELDSLYAKLNYATKGTKDYDAAKHAIESRFSPYIQKLREEGVEVNNLANIYDNLVDKITEANQARYMEAATEDLDKAYGGATKEIQTYFDKLIKEIEQAQGRAVTAMERQGLWQYVTGGLTKENSAKYYEVVKALQKGLSATTVQWGYFDDMAEMAGMSPHYASMNNRTVLYWMQHAWKDATDAYVTGMNEAKTAFDAFNRSQTKAAADGGKNLVYNIKSIVEGIKNYDADIARLREKAKKEGLIVDEEKGIDEKQQLENLVTARKEQADLYKEIMGVDYDKDTRKSETDAERARKERIAEIKTKVTLLEKYLSMYQRLANIGKSDEEINALLSSDEYFGKREGGYSNLTQEILNFTAALRALGDEGKDAADAIEARLGIGKVADMEKQYKEATKALETYLKVLDKMEKKVGDTENQGVAHKVQNAIDKYNDTVKEANDDFTKGSDALAKAGITDPTEMAEKTAALVAARNNLIATAKNTLKNDVGGLDDALFKELMSGFDLSNWNDKTYSQIEAIRQALGAVKVPDAIREMLSKTPEGKTALDALDTALQKLVDDMNNNTVDPEWWKKVGREIRKVASDFRKVADAAVEYGEVIGEDWGKALDTMKEMGETLAVMAERWVKEDWIGVASAGLSFLIAKIIEAATEAKRLEIQLADLQEQARHATLMSAISNIGESIFGTNDLEKLRQGMDGVNDALERMNELASKGFYGKMTYKGASSGNWFLDFLSLFNNGDHRTAYGGTYSQWFPDVASALSRYNLPVFDENGILNRDSLEALKKLVPDMESDLQKLINSIDEYYAALEQVEGVMSELVGDIADEAASKLIDQWVEAGNAALDYADILDDVARSYAQMVLKDMILKAMPKGLAEKLTSLAVTGDNENFMKTLAEAMEGIRDLEPYIQQILEAFDPYFSRDDEESGSLGKGIKSITEETASLLASYLNAIRADVSYMRSMAESGWLNVETIAGVVTPKLADYVQQIAANTANNAENTAQILSDLRSVIGTPDTDGMVVRVQQM